MKKLAFVSGISLSLGATLLASHAQAAIISNGVPAGTLGHWSMDITTGGESRQADLTAQRLFSGNLTTENVLFDYFTYIDIGGGGFQLSGTDPVGDSSQVSSSGSFLGSLGNTISWNVTSAIAPGSTLMTNTFTLDAGQGFTLGDIALYQYMDEDIEGVNDDIFFTRGSAAGNNLELFTVDNQERYGVSHGGAYDDTQGLVNATFAGWAVDNYNDMKPQLTAGTQAIADGGVIDGSLVSFIDPDLGLVYGPDDIVSVLGWSVDPDAQTATIITTIGGVPDGTVIPTVPEPAAVGGLLLVGVLGYWSRRDKQPAA